MSLEFDAHQVVYFTLLKVGSLPEAGERRHYRIFAVAALSLYHQRLVVLQRSKLVHQLEIFLVIDSGDAVQPVELESRFGLKKSGHGQEVPGFNEDTVFRNLY